MLIFCVFVAKSLEMVTYFFLRIPRNGYQFSEKLPLDTGMGFESPAVHPRPNQI